MNVKKFKGVKGAVSYQFNLPIYNIPYDVFIGKTMPSTVKAAEKDFPGLQLGLEPTEAAGFAGVVNHPTEGTCFLMLLTTDTKGDYNHVIAHEALHLAWYMCDHVGVDLSWDNHEAQAYVLSELIRKVNKAMTHYKNNFTKHKKNEKPKT